MNPRTTLRSIAFLVVLAVAGAPALAQDQIAVPGDYTPPPQDDPADPKVNRFDEQRGSGLVPLPPPPPGEVPEIGAAALGSLAALLAGGALLFDSRRRAARVERG